MQLYVRVHSGRLSESRWLPGGGQLVVQSADLTFEYVTVVFPCTVESSGGITFSDEQVVSDLSVVVSHRHLYVFIDSCFCCWWYLGFSEFPSHHELRLLVGPLLDPVTTRVCVCIGIRPRCTCACLWWSVFVPVSFSWLSLLSHYRTQYASEVCIPTSAVVKKLRIMLCKDIHVSVQWINFFVNFDPVAIFMLPDSYEHKYI